jgi:hypothetical protein
VIKEGDVSPPVPTVPPWTPNDFAPYRGAPDRVKTDEERITQLEREVLTLKLNSRRVNIVNGVIHGLPFVGIAAYLISKITWLLFAG